MHVMTPAAAASHRLSGARLLCLILNQTAQLCVCEALTLAVDMELVVDWCRCCWQRLVVDMAVAVVVMALLGWAIRVTDHAYGHLGPTVVVVVVDFGPVVTVDVVVVTLMAVLRCAIWVMDHAHEGDRGHLGRMVVVVVVALGLAVTVDVVVLQQFPLGNRHMDPCYMGGRSAVFGESACCRMPVLLPSLLCLQLSAHCQSTATSSLTRSVTVYHGRFVPATVVVITLINCAAAMFGCCALDLCRGCNCGASRACYLAVGLVNDKRWLGSGVDLIFGSVPRYRPGHVMQGSRSPPMPVLCHEGVVM